MNISGKGIQIYFKILQNHTKFNFLVDNYERKILEKHQKYTDKIVKFYIGILMIPVILLIAFGLVKQEFPYEIS
jgi:hypothetical protein